MTADDAKLLRYLQVRGVASWAELRAQFGMSEGALTVPVNYLKRQMFIEQDGPYYRLTSIGQAALTHAQQPLRKPFTARPEW